MKLRFLVPLLAGLLLAGCAGGGRGISFLEENGRAQRLRPAGEGRYTLKRPVQVAGRERAFYLGFEALSPASAASQLRVLDGKGQVVAVRRLLPSSARLSLQVPLPDGVRVGGFALEPPPRPLPVLSGAGITRALTGLDLRGGALSIGTGVRSLALGPGFAEVSLEAEAFPELWRLELEFELAAPADWADFRRLEGGLALPGRRARARLELAGDGRRKTFTQEALAGPQRLFFYPATVGFAPARVALRSSAGGFAELKRLEIAPRLAAGPGSGEAPGSALAPLPADPGTVLLYDPLDWRQPEYELFAWERFPGILILDTADYEVQDRFFKRLAFYVEKLGYRGRLVSEEEVRSLHGFNAHDYRAEDLASFYNQAAAERFALTREELLLRDILLTNGLLRRGGSLQAGEGAVLAVSRGSNEVLRRLLLTHEAFHGLYFTLPRYREACQEAWRTLSPPEREFWRMFLRWGAYDYEDEYLAANELQAYLFQQPRENLGYYFGELTAGRLRRANPQRADWLRVFFAEHPGSFEQAFDRLAPVLRREAGLEGGRIVELERR